MKKRDFGGARAPQVGSSHKFKLWAASVSALLAAIPGPDSEEQNDSGSITQLEEQQDDSDSGDAVTHSQ